MCSIACEYICVCQVQVHIQCFTEGLEYYVCPCLLAYVGIIELSIKHRAREREIKRMRVFTVGIMW